MLKSMIYTLVTADKKKELELLLFVQAPTVHAMVFRRVSFAYAWKYSLGSKLDSVFSDQNWMALVLDSSFDKQLIEQFPAGACLKCQVNLSFLPPILDIYSSHCVRTCDRAAEILRSRIYHQQQFSKRRRTC